MKPETGWFVPNGKYDPPSSQGKAHFSEPPLSNGAKSICGRSEFMPTLDSKENPHAPLQDGDRCSFCLRKAQGK